MSPYPTQITREAIITAAWERVEAEGFDRLSLHKLASQLGVKAPSLYRYIQSKNELLRAINELTEARLFAVIGAALADSNADPRTQLIALSQAYRDFAHTHPITYMLAFTTIDPAARPDPTAQEQAVLPVQRIIAQISGEADSLPALRGLLALVHGFVMLELNQQLRRGGDLDEAFSKSLTAYLAGW
jgi:AcrR family transcriptional regulator